MKKDEQEEGKMKRRRNSKERKLWKTGLVEGKIFTRTGVA